MSDINTILNCPTETWTQIGCSSLGKTGWTESTMSEVRSVLTLDYTSSDKSCYECPSDSEEVQLICYKTKRLQWERSTLTKAKKVLDLTYERTLTRPISLSRVPRELSEEMSNRDSLKCD